MGLPPSTLQQSQIPEERSGCEADRQPVWAGRSNPHPEECIEVKESNPPTWYEMAHVTAYWSSFKFTVLGLPGST